MRLQQDRRAQSMAFLQAAGTLVLFAALYAIFQEPAQMMFETGASVSTTEQAARGQGYVEQIWTWLPLAAMGLIVLMLLARAVAASGRA